MKKAFLFALLFVAFSVPVFSAYTYCVELQSGTVCLNNTILTGTKINASDVLNLPSSATDDNNYTDGISFEQNSSTYTFQLSRSGIPSNLTASFTVSSSGGGGSGVTVTAGPNWPVKRNATNSSVLEDLSLICGAGYGLSSVTNNSVCTQFETPASAAATYYPLTNPAGYTSNTGTVTSVSITTNGSNAIVVSGGPITTSGTLNIQVQNATTTQDGLMTATQATSLSLKALAGNCVGSNSTHVNVTMNATTSGVQCVAVARNPGSGSNGTVTSVATGNGLTGGPITTSGTLSVNATTCTTGNYTQWNGTAFNCQADTGFTSITVTNPDTFLNLTVVGSAIAARINFTSFDARYALKSVFDAFAAAISTNVTIAQAAIVSIGNWTLDKPSYTTTALGDSRWGNQSFNVTCSAGTYPQSFAFNKDGTQNSTTCVTDQTGSGGSGNVTGSTLTSVAGFLVKQNNATDIGKSIVWANETQVNVTLPTVSGTPYDEQQSGFNDTQKMISTYSNGMIGNVHRTVGFATGSQSKTNSVTLAQDFTSLYSFPANTIFTNKVYRVSFTTTFVTGTSSVTAIHYMKLGSVNVTSVSLGNIVDSATPRTITSQYLIEGLSAVGATANVTTSPINNPGAVGTAANTVSQPVARATNGALALTIGITWSGTGSTETMTLNSVMVEELN